MHLYSHVRSPWCRKVEWSIAEMRLSQGVAVQVIGEGNADAKPAVDAMKAKHGPHATMPTLVDGEFVLSESSAIVFYLADKANYDGDFLPKNIAARALITQWDRICDINLGAGILSPWLRNTLFLGDKPADPSVPLKAAENFKKLESQLSDALTKNKFLASNFFTYADVGMAHLLASLMRVDGPKPTSQVVQKWLESCTNMANYTRLAARS